MATTPSPLNDPGVAHLGAQATALPDQRQWLRKCKLVAANDAGQGLDLSQLEFKFETVSITASTMKSLNCRIYNLSDATANKIQQMSHIQLSVAYGDNDLAVIFDGLTTFFRRGKDATDSYLDITAGDCATQYNWGIVKHPLKAGSSLEDLFEVVLAALAPDVTRGDTPDLNDVGLTDAQKTAAFPSRLPRGQSIYKSVIEVLSMIADAANCNWSFEDGRLDLIPVGGFREGGSLVLNTQSGLVGTPEQTLDGLVIRCLLNPKIKKGRALQVATSLVATAQQVQARRQIDNADHIVPGLSQLGLYKVYQVRHMGDMRSNEWFTEAICEAIAPDNGLGPNSQTFANAGPQ
jgi:hypothetical protein